MFRLIKSIYTTIFITTFVFAICLAVNPIQIQARPVFGPEFMKTNTSGFGDVNNSYAHSMAWFNGKLYVGTSRNLFELMGLSGIPVPLEPFPVEVPASFWDLDLRAEVWEYTPGSGLWTRFLQSPTIKVIDPEDQTEHETALDEGYRIMTVFQDALYIASSSFLPIPTGIWRYDGVNPPIRLEIDPGMPLPEGAVINSIRSLTAFNDKLYTSP